MRVMHGMNAALRQERRNLIEWFDIVSFYVRKLNQKKGTYHIQCHPEKLWLFHLCSTGRGWDKDLVWVYGGIDDLIRRDDGWIDRVFLELGIRRSSGKKTVSRPVREAGEGTSAAPETDEGSAKVVEEMVSDQLARNVDYTLRGQRGRTVAGAASRQVPRPVGKGKGVPPPPGGQVSKAGEYKRRRLLVDEDDDDDDEELSKWERVHATAESMTTLYGTDPDATVVEMSKSCKDIANSCNQLDNWSKAFLKAQKVTSVALQKVRDELVMKEGMLQSLESRLGAVEQKNNVLEADNIRIQTKKVEQKAGYQAQYDREWEAEVADVAGDKGGQGVGVAVLDGAVAGEVEVNGAGDVAVEKARESKERTKV
ncbi:hypothetical protein GIB67_006607 [Kingdonia uniflora]|uniref:Uncharacterized protein n=1 Tax=Kingdonia uniflora TaxID=39325 RepID=A0A7J7MBW1_9MAGN|nr:hypothetical protein GIB67_006607 [Kingdonia uniflora]